MIDIHSHILPGIDDGAKDLETSLKMLKMAEEKGTKIIVATPHYIHNRYENLYEENLKLYEYIKKEALAADINIEILLGQEIMLDKNSLNLCKEKRLRGINDTQYILVEFPMDKLPKDALDLIYELRLLNFIPILAHPERYVYILEEIELVNDFLEEGCLFQINTGSLQGMFGKKVQNCAKDLVSHELVSFIASDAHSVFKRCPGLAEGFSLAEGFKKGITEKMNYNLNAVIKGEDLELQFEKIKKRKKFFSFFK